MAGTSINNHSRNGKTNFIQVSVDRNSSFYASIGKRMLTGSPEKPAINEIVVSGLGVATKTAIGTASILQHSNKAYISKIETSCYVSTNKPQGYYGRYCTFRNTPKITITLKKVTIENGVLNRYKDGKNETDDTSLNSVPKK